MAREMNVVPYDDGWPPLYEQEKAILLGVFGKTLLDMQHFGSTSVPGMAAKPTIDIMAVVPDIQRIDKYNEAMSTLAYLPRGEHGIPGRRYFVKLKEDGENHAVHLHVYGIGNPHIKDELMFRDFLRSNRDAFIQYENVKKAASQAFRYAPEAYQKAKQDCVAQIMAKARQYEKNR